MQRRDLLKSLAAVPFAAISLKTGEKADAAELKPGRYLIFYDHQRIDNSDLLEGWPQDWPIDAVAVPIVTAGKPIQDCIAIYRMDENG